ncbi:regulatory protein [Sulfobacillus thermosulfidooxidans DSM 9293]|uniref:Regulatory protein RecX n=2 Tax=Sulfobacillus thermosulfidooxidans TaxID=28034 RepID=A0A1W1WM68_SULTA|nr:regulatory protein RecX [Sulfobacillus thermosulfidooxidans]PSR29757.1 MAG: RecX family transcriptional regulator [Sulfobacillus thermosulfidooxidans]SMC07120.1 regulatory protein [Sulfobacillus thermosulfidooxidans DSM 9293]
MSRTSNKDPYIQALRWLGYRDYSSACLAKRLREQGYDQLLVEQTVSRLIDEGWLDDFRLARQIIEQCLATQTMGPGLIRHRLMSRGLSREIWDNILQERIQAIDWLKIAEALEERYDMNEPRERLRFGRYLIRRGFPTAVAWQLAGPDNAPATEKEC